MKSALRMTAAVTASILVHLLVLNAARLMPALPDSDFSFETPVNVDFGFVDPAPPSANLASAAVPEETAGGAAEPAATEMPSSSDPSEPRKPEPDAAMPETELADGGIDAGLKKLTDAGPTAPSDAVLDAGAADGSVETKAAAAPLIAGKRGAQVSLRLDLAALRNTSYAQLLAPLVTQSGDVRAILDGSEIDPLRDLDRLWVASPDLTRERAVIAGQYHGGTSVAVAAARRLSSAQAPRLRFRQRGPFQVAPWRNPDPTPRVLALLGSETFVIARDADLQAVLAIAQRLTEPAKSDKQGADRLGRSLLNLGTGALLQLDVEGVGSFVHDRGGQPPLRLTARARLNTKQPGIAVDAEGIFATAEEAISARDRLEALQKRYATHPLVMILGFSRVIRSVEFKAHDKTLTLRANLSEQDVVNLVAVLVPPPPPTAAPPASRPASPPVPSQ